MRCFPSKIVDIFVLIELSYQNINLCKIWNIFVCRMTTLIIRILQQDPFLKQFCLEDVYSCSSDYLWYPYYPEYHDYCYQNVISRDNTGLSPADNIYWLGCIIASEGRNLNNRFDPNERLNWDLSLQTGILRYAKPRRRLFRKRLKQQ